MLCLARATIENQTIKATSKLTVVDFGLLKSTPLKIQARAAAEELGISAQVQVCK